MWKQSSYTTLSSYMYPEYAKMTAEDIWISFFAWRKEDVSLNAISLFPTIVGQLKHQSSQTIFPIKKRAREMPAEGAQKCWEMQHIVQVRCFSSR